MYYLVVARLVPRETAAVSAAVTSTPFNHAPVYTVTSFKAVEVGSFVFSCNLSPVLWQNDLDLLLATAVTVCWSGYRNKSQHRKWTLEKNILPPLHFYTAFCPHKRRNVPDSSYLRSKHFDNFNVVTVYTIKASKDGYLHFIRIGSDLL